MNLRNMMGQITLSGRTFCGTTVYFFMFIQIYSDLLSV